MTIRFADLVAERPTRESLLSKHVTIAALLDRGDRAGALARWDSERRAFETWFSLVHLRFSQNTTDPAAVADRDYADSLAPEATELDTAIKRRLLSEADRAGLEDAAGAHAVRLWECDIATFDPANKSDLEEEAGLSARYTALMAGARFDIGSRTVNLSGLAPYAESQDRTVRYEAERKRWAFFGAHGAELDSIYADLVTVRHRMATKLGYATYTPLGYKRLRRVDYGPEDVACYRDQVLTHVVPLVVRLLDQRRVAFGWDRLRFWDEALVDPAGNPRPAGDADYLVSQAQIMFDRMDERLGSFFRMMNEGGFLDLANRPGKAGGGFCTSFPSISAPYIFANFTGTHQDIGVFTHEMGHAFQNWESRALPNVDYLWPTMEAAEIDSMALEFLTYPHMDLMVGPDAADRFRRMHLISALAFLPYGVCVDHFQHEIYAHPTATPAERHAIWSRLERLYMPWTDYGDLDYPAKGGRWQAKQHIYGTAFYYIDYTLAQCCALQFWVRSRHDMAAALDTYATLCARGGSAAFGDLVRSAGLVTPFADGALAGVVREAAAVLGL